MSQYKAIPQPGDQRNVSQNDILTNFNYLSTPLNPGGGVANGVIPVDHFATGDNVANPTDGFHKQVSFQDRATPANLTNAINSQNSSGIEYSKRDGQGTSQVRYLNSIIDSPITYLKAAVLFDPTGAILGNAFNVSSVTNGPVGQYVINFTVPMFSLNYLVFITNSGTPRFVQYTTKNLNNVRVTFFPPLGGATTNPTVEASVQVIGFF